ncbi:MAG: WD40 repeat domain-containing protein, partial [Planctomycetota bacterium]
GNAAPIETLWGQYAAIEEVSFNRDNQTIATCGTWCAKTWDFQSNDRRSFGMDFHVRILDAAIANDSQTIYTADERGRLSEFCLETKSHLETIGSSETNESFRSVDVSSDGQMVAWTCDDGCVYVRDRISRETECFSGHEGNVTSVSFADDNKGVYSSSNDGTVRAWELRTGESTVVLESDQPQTNALASPCGRWLAVGDKSTIQVLQTGSYGIVASLRRKRAYTEDGYDMAFSEDGEMLIAASERSQATVWSIPTGTVIGELVEHSMPIRSVAFSPCGTRVVTASREGTIKLWDTKYFQVVLSLHGFSGYAETIDFSPDGEKLVAGLYDGSIQVWETLAESRRPKE